MPSNRNGSRNTAKRTAKAPTKNAELRTSRFTPGAYFRDRVVLITGASSGIGRDLALTFAKMGAKVALIARRKSLLETLADEITAAGGEALPLAADVTRRSDVRDAVDRTLAHFSRIDVLINSAGVAIPDRVETMPPEDLERMMAVNLMGTLHTMQAVLPSMRAAGAGSIVNIASLAGRRGMPPLGAYCATKFAVVGLTEALRVELYGSGIRLSLVMPGVIDTPMVHGASSTQSVDQAASGKDPFKLLPDSIPAMPAHWVTWAVIAAVVLGLTEVDVPPGAVVMEKIAALFPSLTDAVLALGTRLFDWATRRP
jgi:NAD(P)-dependent dehydrogenase (short-subunit alcohol dehydrogenase family)